MTAIQEALAVEAEIRAVLSDAVRQPDDGADLFQSMLGRFGEIGGVELQPPRRRTPVRAADHSA